jgi:hypothetical protein
VAEDLDEITGEVIKTTNMSKGFSNPCVRCGKERVVLRIWKERVYDSVVENTETICPDPECQKLVNKDNKKLKDRYTALKLKSEQRAVHRNQLRNLSKVKKRKS